MGTVVEEYEKEVAEWQALSEAGHEAYGRKKLVVSEEKFVAALKLAESWNEKDSLKESDDVKGRLSKTLNNLGAIYHAQGKYGMAEEAYNRALAIKEKLFGAEHTEVAVCLQNLAAVFSARGMLDKASPLYEKALAIKESAFGEMHPDLLTVLKNYELLLRRLRRKEESEKVLARIKQIEKSAREEKK